MVRSLFDVFRFSMKMDSTVCIHVEKQMCRVSSDSEKAVIVTDRQTFVILTIRLAYQEAGPLIRVSNNIFTSGKQKGLFFNL